MLKQELIDLLQGMTLEEKVNQMLQVAGGFFQGEIFATGPMREKGFTEKNISLAGSVIGAMGADTIKKIQEEFIRKHPHKIPLLFMLDVINGFKTIFPIPLGQGATFEPEISERCAEAAAKEAAVSGVHVTFAPMVDTGCTMGKGNGVYRRGSLFELPVCRSYGKRIPGKRSTGNISGCGMCQAFCRVWGAHGRSGL